MGYGDDIMATAYAEAVHDQFPEAKAVFGDPKTYHDPGANSLKVHFTEVFLNNPYIVQQDEPVKNLICLPDYPGCRMYIDYEGCETNPDSPQEITRFKWKSGFKAPRGALYFTNDEKSAATEIALRLPKDFIVIEPYAADKPWAVNKDWHFDRWAQVVKALPEVGFVQLSEASERMDLPGVIAVNTPSFRQAAAILSTAGAFVGAEGGMHHAAAALSIPAIVLWSHYTSPAVLGYDDQVNIRHADGDGCGTIDKPCEECGVAMDKITVEEVVGSIKELINEGRHKTCRQGPDRPVFRMVEPSAEGGQK